MILEYSNELAKFYTVEYMDMQYFRNGDSKIVPKRFQLFRKKGNNLNLIPSSRSILKYKKEFKNLFESAEITTAPLDVEYNGIPSIEQRDNLGIIHERMASYDYCAGLIVMKTGRGKALPLYSKVLTNNGWKTMGDISIGDYVIGKDGKSKIVKDIPFKGKDKIYEIELSNGLKCRASGNHLFEVNEILYSRKTINHNITVNEILQKGLIQNNGRKRFSIDKISPVHFNKKELKIDPYLLGIILSEGSISQNNIHIHINNKEIDLIDNIIDKINITNTYNILDKNKGCTRISCIGINGKNNLKDNLKYYGLMGTVSDTKFIPKDYLYSSLEDRIELLKGLIDGDGYIINNKTRPSSCSIEISTVSKNIMEGIKELVLSLGGNINISIKNKPKYQTGFGKKAYICKISIKDIKIFSSKKHNSRYKINRKYKTKEYIKSITYIGEEECKCINVEGGLFITDNYILTHNSHMIAQIIGLIKRKTLISVHNKKTLQEMVEKLNSSLGGSIKIGQYYSDKKEMGDIIVTTHTSLSKEKGSIVINGTCFEPEVLLYDEADRNLSSNMIEAFTEMHNIKWMYGLTGTPQAKNITTKDMEKIFGKIIQSQESGYNLIPVIKYIRYKTPNQYMYGNWIEYRECLASDADRLQEQIKYIKHVMKFRKVGLLMSDRRLEVERYYELLKNEDYEVILIHGDTKIKDDNDALSNTVFKGKKTLIIGTAGKVSRGVDIPPIDTIFLFYPNKFESATIQAVGRGLRNFEGKENTLLVDWADFDGMGKGQMYSRWKTYREEYGLKIDSKNEAQRVE